MSQLRISNSQRRSSSLYGRRFLPQRRPLAHSQTRNIVYSIGYSNLPLPMHARNLRRSTSWSNDWRYCKNRESALIHHADNRTSERFLPLLSWRSPRLVHNKERKESARKAAKAKEREKAKETNSRKPLLQQRLPVKESATPRHCLRRVGRVVNSSGRTQWRLEFLEPELFRNP